MAITAAQIAHTVTIGIDWEEPGSTEADFENAIVELEYRLIDAPNVKDSYSVSTPYGESIIGIAVELIDGTRTFFLNDNEKVNFDAEGNIVL